MSAINLIKNQQFTTNYLSEAPAFSGLIEIFAETTRTQQVLFETCKKKNVTDLDSSLLRKKPNLLAVDSQGRRPLDIACELGNKALAENLLKRLHGDNGDLASVLNRQGKSALHYAVGSGNVELVKFLIEDCGVDVNLQDGKGWTPLYYVFHSIEDDMFSYLAEKKARLNPKCEKPLYPLLYASQIENQTFLKYLVEGCHVDLEQLDDEGNSALDSAVAVNAFDNIRYLVEKGALLTQEKARSICFIAIKRGDFDFLKFLIENNFVDLNTKDPKERTLFNIVFQFDRLQFAEYFIEKKVPLCTKNELGQIALCKAAAWGNLNVVKELVEHYQIDIHKKTKKGWTPLLVAYNEGQKEVADYLIDRGADREAKVFIGWTGRLLAYASGAFSLQKSDLNDNERAFLELKTLAHWLSLKDYSIVDGQRVDLEGVPADTLFFKELADALKAFQSMPIFKKLQIGNRANIIHQALEEAYPLNRSSSEIINKIEKGELVFLAAGWKNHSITLCFIDDYLAICNRGEGADPASTIQVYHIDRSKMSEKVLLDVKKMELRKPLKGQDYFYNKLPWELSGSRIGYLETISSKPQKAGNCSLASKTAAVRFAWSMLIKNGEQGRLESKLFTDCSACRAMEIYLPFAKLAQSQNFLIPDALAAAQKKIKRFEKLTKSL